jgi:energy-coupling factor transporter transmembrane protein EcfT
MDIERLDKVRALLQKQRSCVMHHNRNVRMLLVVAILTFLVSFRVGGFRQLPSFWIVLAVGGVVGEAA